jgi:serine/threonine-protein kinase
MESITIPGYTVVRSLAGGGMTDVYLALDQQRRRVVVRVLQETYVHHRRMRKNFLNGARIHAQLEHDGLVRFIESGRLDHRPFIVTEYVESQTLRDLLVHRDAFVSANVLSLLREIAEPLYYVHSAGFLHLDFKPENLLVTPEGDVRLIDFDLALPYHNRPVHLRAVPGTPAYVAPEALTRHRVDERADIFSFGVVCYEMLTFHKPFETDDPRNDRAAIVDESVRPTPLKRYNEHVPPPLRSLVLKCLAKDPERRYPSMSLVIKDLEAIL